MAVVRLMRIICRPRSTRLVQLNLKLTEMARLTDILFSKIIVSIMISGSIASCKSTPTADTRPKEQVNFTKIVKQYREAVANSANESHRTQYLNLGVDAVKTHILDTLNLKFSDWDARVLDDAKSSADPDAREITYGLSIDDFNLEENSRYKSIVFRGTLSNTSAEALKIADKLVTGDHVKISGTFISKNEHIDVDPYNLKNFRDSKNIFANPMYRVEISDVRVED